MDENCRLCYETIKKSSKNVSDSLEHCTEETISSIIEYFFRVNVTQDNSFPKQVCEECCGKLVELKAFQKRIQETDSKLHNALTMKYCLDDVKSDEIDYNLLIPEQDDITMNNDSVSSDSEEEFKEKVNDSLNKQNKRSKTTLKRNKPKQQQQTDVTPKRKQFQCEFCGKILLLNREFKLHIDLHVGRPLPEFSCEICGKVYNRKNSFFEHRRTHKEPSFQCEECGKKFLRRNRLTHHILVKHKGERPFQCQLCDKRFGDSGTLHNHTRSHTDEKLLECSVCGEKFKYLQPIQQHIIRYHADGETDKEVLSRMITKLKSLNTLKPEIAYFNSS